jgi:alkylation response protein AidB-like acyl-CoA dehydrogenase
MSDADVAGEIRSVLDDVLEKGPEGLAAGWGACAEAGLLSLAAPERLGGEGLGLAELAVLVHGAAARDRDLPFFETLVCGLLPIVGCGSDEVQQALVPRIVAGDLLVAPALQERGDPLPPVPSVVLADGRLTGTKTGVRRFEELVDARTMLVVTASGPDGPVAVLVEPDSGGVTCTPTFSSSGLAEATYSFESAPVTAVLEGPSGELLRTHFLSGLLTRGSGLLAGARDLTARYVKEREQFGRSLAEFQGVAMQAADVYVTARLLELAADEVTRRVAAREPAETDAAVGAHWFSERGLRALQTCHHLHGGMGVDETYPLHRYFARAKDTARLLGGTEYALARVPVQDRSTVANLELTAEQRAFKAEVRDYFADLVSAEDRLEMMRDRHGEAYHRTIRQMGKDGWMGVGWPTEYGGKGLGGIEQQVFANEAARADVHLPSVTLQTVGPTLQAFGTQKQKDLFLHAILAGEVHFAIGYSEADAGTDLASLRTTARRVSDEADGDHYVVNGQKMWTTGGHAADYVWLAVRTDPEAPKHKGISVLIVDTRDPGYSWTPIITSDGSHHVNATYYTDVRVPADMLVGEENEGWRLITTQLNHERVMLGPAGRIEGLRDLVLAWADGRTDHEGSPLLAVPWVRDTLARATAAFRLNELLNWKVAGAGATGREAVADASASKVFASDEVQSLGLALERIVTTYGDPADPETARLVHYLDATSKRNLVLTFGGGVNEVQRELIAMFGLGLPKVPR